MFEWLKLLITITSHYYSFIICVKTKVNYFVHVGCIIFVFFFLSDVFLPLDLYIFIIFLSP